MTPRDWVNLVLSVVGLGMLAVGLCYWLGWDVSLVGTGAILLALGIARDLS